MRSLAPCCRSLKKRNISLIHREACGKCVKTSKYAHLPVENFKKKHLFPVDKSRLSRQSVTPADYKLR